MTSPSDASPFLFYLAIGLMFFLMQLSCMETDELEKLVAEAVVNAMHMAGLTGKELAAIMRIDEAQLRRQLKPEPYQHLSLARVVRAWQLWPYLGPALLTIIAKRRWAEVLEDTKSVRRA